MITSVTRPDTIQPIYRNFLILMIVNPSNIAVVLMDHISNI